MPGLPQAMLKKREQLRAEQPVLATAEQPEHVMIPIDVPTRVEENAPIVEETHTESESTSEDLRRELQTWEQRYRSLQGVIANLEPKFKEESKLRQELQDEVKALREAMPQPKPEPNLDEELTPEELEQYGESAPTIQKVARKVARGELESALRDLRKEISELRESTGKIQTGVATSEEERFVNSVKSRVKNFDAITGMQEWLDYLANKQPYTRATIGEALTKAHADRDLDSVVEIFEGFKPSKSALERMKSPIMNGGGAPINHNGNAKPMLKWSDRQKISEDFRKGRIKLEEKNKWDRLFKEAEKESRIDYNK